MASIPSTIIAEVIFAEQARHMVASLRFLDLCATHRTKYDSIHTFTPSFESFFHSLLARSAVSMPILFATEANGVIALGTY